MDKGKERARFDLRHIFSWLVLFSTVLWSVIVCRDSYIRLFWSFISLGKGFVYALFFNYEWCPVPDVVSLHVDVSTHFPDSWVAFSEDFNVFIKLFFSRDNFVNFSVWLSPKLQVITQLIMLLSICFLCFYIVKTLQKPKRNNRHGEETKALRRYKALCSKVFAPPAKRVRAAFAFFRGNKWYYRIFLVVFFCSSNVVTIVVSFFSWYFYVLGSLDFISLFYQLYRLTVDLVIMLDTLPTIVWVLIGIVVFNKLTVHFAYNRLARQQAVNMAFVDSCGIVVYIVGVMRAGKTALQTSLMVLFAIKFRRMSKQIMLKVHRHFPFFPYPVFQQELLSLFGSGEVYSLASFEVYIEDKRRSFVESPCSENMYGYDFTRYGTKHDDGDVIIDIWQDLCTYGEAFLVFTEPTYFVANYSIRECQTLRTVGNCPDFNTDIYRRPSYDGNGEFAHILDQDFLRPGRKMHPERKSYGVIEYGLIAEDEIDKERANMLELQEVKAKDDECNQRNDLYNQHLKMMGHASSIDYKSFVRLFGTSQRSSSWGADGKELSDLVTLVEVSEDRLVLRFFTYREMLGELLRSIHESKTFASWYYRGDTTLPMYLFWQLTKPYLDYYERTIGIFGYRVQTLARQAGTEEGEKTLYKFYDQNKLVRSGVYSTDSHASYFRRKNLEAKRAFDQIPRYDSLHPTFEELVDKSSSHMYNKWVAADKLSEEQKSAPRKR